MQTEEACDDFPECCWRGLDCGAACASFKKNVGRHKQGPAYCPAVQVRDMRNCDGDVGPKSEGGTPFTWVDREAKKKGETTFEHVRDCMAQMACEVWTTSGTGQYEGAGCAWSDGTEVYTHGRRAEFRPPPTPAPTPTPTPPEAAQTAAPTTAQTDAPTPAPIGGTRRGRPPRRPRTP